MKAVLALLVIMLAVAGLSFLVFRAAPGGGCEDQLLEDVTSPDGRSTAARFAHRCGSAAAAIQVALRPAGSPFAPDERATVFATRSARPVRLSWRDERTLVVESTAASLIDPLPQWRNVRIIVRRIH